eukprot:gnl/MRDRNA2_/MRDRNA2_27622_c0_seq1.p1 gnl/MRDRNA2_/MRDRNA2_27622_c0~~gnl/MRDRNA2_/MRDRNA2_27622_c0_seq1.p1  ORF type:complete len:1095 (+),score=104.16 gnl/MRDRNA2_/MRDRNA2_27622_c0_seq1:266-3286(+)
MLNASQPRLVSTPQEISSMNQYIRRRHGKELVQTKATKPKFKIPGRGGKSKIAKAVGTPSAYDIPAEDINNIKSHHGEIECNMSITGIASPKECPKACPYLKYSRHGYCAFHCVTAHDCALVGDPISSYPDPKLNLCRTCEVIGCDVCGSSEFHCFKCSTGFDTVNGLCLSKSRYAWYVAYFTLVSFMFVSFLYVFTLWIRRNHNGAMLKEAIASRKRTQTRMVDDGENSTPYPLTTNLGRTFISGAGIMLHFRWQMMIISWAVFVTIATGTLAWFSRATLKVSRDAPESVEAQTMCMKGVQPEATATFAVPSAGTSLSNINHFDVMYTVMLVGIYAVTSIGSMIFAYCQRKFFSHAWDRFTSMESYVLLVDGLPPDTGQNHVEQEYAAFIQGALPDVEVIGVSVLWNAATAHIDFQSAAERETGMLEEQEFQEELEATRKTFHAPGDPSSSGDQYGGDRTGAVRRPQILSPCLGNIDLLLMGRCCRHRQHPRRRLHLKRIRAELRKQSPRQRIQHTPRKEQMIQALRDLTSSGSAFVVFNTHSDLEIALSVFGENQSTGECENNAPLFRGVYPITMKRSHCDPQTVLWSNWGKTFSEFHYQIFLGIASIVLALSAWIVILYGPYAYYIVSYSTVRGMNEGSFVQSTLLGLLIAAGNFGLYTMAQIVASRAGFHYKDRQDRFYVVLYTVAVFINTCLDLWVVTVVARGYSLMSATQMGPDRVLSSSLSYRHSLYVQLLSYLYPGTLFIPFLLEPMVALVLPFYLGKWLVRSRPDIFRKLRDAEDCMSCPYFDLSRYGDILMNVMLCILMLYLAPVDLWWTFLYLTLSLLYIYVLDHYRFLRCTQGGVYADDSMDKTAQYLCAVPCSLLAGCTAHRLLQHHHLINLANALAMIIMPAVFTILHLVLHVGILTRIEKMGIKQQRRKRLALQHTNCIVTYKEAASHFASSWFNANPVHCLRSKYIYNHDPPCVYFIRGQQHLIKRNENIGVYFNPPPAPKVKIESSDLD